MEKILTIVIPTYNMEKYLRRCLDSIVIQEIIANIEIIIVNDGSTDSSLCIAESYKEQYPESVTVIDKKNGHYGSCINAALGIARGKYFRTLDADDLFDKAGFIKLVNFLQTRNVDLIITDNTVEKPNGSSEVITLNKAAILPKVDYNFVDTTFSNNSINKMLNVHTITYKTQLLLDANYMQTEGVSYTDTEFSFYPLEYVRIFTYLDVIVYRYQFGVPGQSVSEISIAKNKDDIYLIICRMARYFELRINQIAAIREIQYCTFRGLVTTYYYSILMLNKRNREDDIKLQTVDASLKRINVDMYESIERKTYFGMKYIRIWRHKNKYCGETVQYYIIKMIRNLRRKILCLKRW